VKIIMFAGLTRHAGALEERYFEEAAIASSKDDQLNSVAADAAGTFTTTGWDGIDSAGVCADGKSALLR
jgi:hypothetical protein